MLLEISIVILAAASVTSSLMEKTFTYPKATTNLASVVHDGNKSYIGGFNYVLAIDRSNGSASRMVSIEPEEEKVRICQSFITRPVNERDCPNAITLLAKMNSTHLVACGTNVQKPKCYYLNLLNDEVKDADFSGRFLSANPDIYQPAVVLKGDTSDPEMYVGACGPNSRCSFSRQINNNLMTQWNANMFSGLFRPVYSGIYVSDGTEKRTMYMFYRDTTTAFDNDGFTADAPRGEYGMVAKICEVDQGGSYLLMRNFVTFLNARLLCPYPGGDVTGNANAYYNMLMSTYRVGNIIYGLFILPPSWGVSASAVCAFDLDVIESHMNGSTFDSQAATYYDPTYPDFKRTFTSSTRFRPGQCPPEGVSSRSVSNDFETIIQETTLLGQNINPLNNAPSYQTATNLHRFVVAAEVGPYHIVYLLSENGLLEKVRLNATTSSQKTPLYKIQLGISDEIKSFSLIEQDLLILTSSRLIQRSPSDCSLHSECDRCEADPHCNWVLDAIDQTVLCVSDSSDDLTVDTCLPSPDPCGSITTSGSSPSLSVQWQPSPDGTRVTSYVMEFIRTADDAVVLRRKIDTSAPTVDGIDVPPGAGYIVSVKARNGLVESTASTTSYTEELQNPNIKVEAVRDTSCQLLWDKVPGAGSYNINLYEASTNDMIRSFITSTDSKEKQIFFIGGLSQDEGYAVSLFAMSSFGVNSNTSSLSFVTNQRIDSDSSNIAGIIVLVVLLLIVLILLLPLQFAVGWSTKEIMIGPDKIKLIRKYIFFWREDVKGARKAYVVE